MIKMIQKGSGPNCMTPIVLFYGDEGLSGQNDGGGG